MALTFNGVSTEELSVLKKPTGFTDPAVTPVTGPILWQWPNTLYVDRETVYDADRATTLQNILDDATIGLNKQCEDIAGQLENTTNTVEAYAILQDNGNNIDPDVPSSDFYLNVADKYVLPVIIYAKVTI